MVIGVKKSNRRLLMAWKARVEKHYGLSLSWDQVLTLYANSEALP